MAAALITLCLWGIAGARPAQAQSSGLGSCIQPASGFSGCTANDVNFGTFFAIVDDGCTGPNDTFTAIVKTQIVGTANQRYDVGLWLNLNGASAITDNGANACFRQTLSPVTVGQPDLTSGNGPFRELEEGAKADACGDLAQGELNVITLNSGQPLTLACIDSDSDGAADLPAGSSCYGYDNQQGNACSGFLQALPSQTSKCGCNETPINLPVTTIPMTIDKVCNPGSAPTDALPYPVRCTITYTNHSTTQNASGFTLLDNYDQSKGSISGISNNGLDNGDVISWTLSALSPGASGTQSYTYTLNAGLSEGTIITNTATLYFRNALQDIADEATLSVVTPVADLSVRKDDGNAFYAPGAQTSYTIVVSNTGPSPANGVIIQDAKPSQVSNWTWLCTAATGGAAGCDGETNSSDDFADTVDLPPGASLTYRVMAILASTASGDLVNSVTVTPPSGLYDPNPDNNKATDSNLAKGKIIIIKQTDPEASSQGFQFKASYSAADFTLQDGQAYDSGYLNPGGYAVSESLPLGWVQTNAVCDDGSQPAAIDLAAGETVTCIFTNTLPPGNIVILLQTTPDGSPQPFDFTASYNAAGFQLSDGQQNDSGALWPGNYGVALTLPENWRQESAVCDDGSQPSAIHLAAGETVACTFTVSQLGKIIVAKQTDPTGSEQLFGFTSSYDGGFQLRHGERHPSQWLAAGVYTLTENALPAWENTAALCDDGSQPAAIQLDAGEVITCTFTNTLRRGQILVVVQTDPDGSQQIFSFAASYAQNSFQLQDGQQNDSGALLPGIYSISQIALAGWRQGSASCDDGSQPDAIDLAPGETVICTFYNTQLGRIIVDKATIPTGVPNLFQFNLAGPQGIDLDFSLSDGATPFDSGVVLPPGHYSLIESSLPPGWTLDSIACSDDSSGNINLAAGQTISCQVANRFSPKGSIHIRKLTTPLTPGVAFTFATSGFDLAQFSLMHGDQQRFNDLPTGQYTIQELPADGWQLIDIECNGAVNSQIQTSDSSVSIDLALNENILCTFTNDPLPAPLQVSKSANPETVPETGAVVEFDVVVNNPNGEALMLTSLLDDRFGDLNNVGTCVLPQTLAGNDGVTGGADSYHCTFSRLLAGDFPANHRNIVTAVASDDEENAAQGSDDAVVIFANVLPELSVAKSAAPAIVPESGAWVAFSFRTVNHSLEAGTLEILQDDRFGDLNGKGSCLTPQPLGAWDGVTGGADTYECTYTTFINGNFGAGSHANTVTAIIADDDGRTVWGTASAKVAFSDLPSALAVSKLAQPQELPEPGGTTTFTVLITNTSTVDVVTIQQLSDDRFSGEMDCVRTLSTPLLPGESNTCSYTAQVEGNAGELYTNQVIINAIDDDGQALSAGANAVIELTDVTPELVVSKQPDVAALPEPGGAVSFTIVISNSSPADAITITSLHDTAYGDIGATCLPSPLGRTLATGEAISCVLTGNVTGNAGDVHRNTVVVRGMDDDGNAVVDAASASLTLTNTPSAIMVDKLVQPKNVPESGGNVTFTVRITNTSPVDAVTINGLNDSAFGDVSAACLPTLPQLLQPGQTLDCTFTRFVAGDVGTKHVNTVTVSGVDDDRSLVIRQASAEVAFTDTLPILQVSKSAAPALIPESGGFVEYTIAVRNQSLIDVITLIGPLIDSKFGDISAQCEPSLMGAVLLAGQSRICRFSQWVNGDVETPHHNLVTVYGFGDDGDSLSAAGAVSVTFSDVAPSITVTKRASAKSVIAPGADVVFTVEVQNTSTVDAFTLQSLVDSVYGNLLDVSNPRLKSNSCQSARMLAAQALVPGASYTCNFTAFVSGAAGDIHQNTVTATGIDDDQVTISGQGAQKIAIGALIEPVMTATKRDALALDLNSNGVVDSGDIIRYTVIVSNGGAGSASAVIFSDLPDPNTTLVIGSVETSKGSVMMGNRSGDAGVEVSIGLIEQDAMAVIQFDVRINNPLPQDLQQVANQGAVRVANFPTTMTDDPDTPAAADPTTTPVQGQAILLATKSDVLAVDVDGNGMPSPGDILEYRVVVVNSGNVAATGVFVNDLFDANSSLWAGSVTASRGNVISGNNPGDASVRVELGLLAGNGGQAIIRFRVQINPSLPAGLTRIVNQATVSSNEQPATLTDDPDTAAANDATVTLLKLQPALNATKQGLLLVDRDANGVPSPGDSLLYNVTLVNNGNAALSGVVFSDALDPNSRLAVGSVQSSKGAVTIGNRPNDAGVAVDIGDIAGQGGSVTISYQVTINSVLPSGVTALINQGYVQSNELPRIPTDDATTLVKNDPTYTPIAIEPRLDVYKRDFLIEDTVPVWSRQGDVTPGDEILYLVTIVNNGNGGVSDVVFDDQPDANTTVVVGTVQSSRGWVVRGNNAGDSSLLVTIPALAGGGDKVSITFRVRVNSSVSASTLANQAKVTVRGTTPGSPELPPLASDDPDTEAVLDDMTLTPLFAGPTALEEGEEPHPAALLYRIFLPAIQSE
jgi:uncharacterized repeat protein (TIGR01451 family)